MHSVPQSKISPHITLRGSVCLRIAMTVFSLIACGCVYVSARDGAIPALALASITFLMLLFGILRYERQRPAMLQIGPNSIRAFGCAGTEIIRGRIVSFSQWGHYLLTLTIRERRGRTQAVLIAGDMLSAQLFRELAVYARHGLRES